MIILENRNDVRSFLANATPRQVTAALLAVYRNQTADERICQSTIHRNYRGFNASDGSRNSIAHYMAKWCVGSGTVDNPRRCLSGAWVAKGKRIVAKYWRQLVAANRAKRAALAMSRGNAKGAISALGLDR